MLCFNFFFLPPVGALTIADPQNWTALGAFLITAITVGQLSARARRRAEEAEAKQREIERLYRELQEAFERASAAEALRRGEQLKTALLDAVTHDLRTPLTAIKVSATSLLDESSAGTDPEGRREMLEVTDLSMPGMDGIELCRRLREQSQLPIIVLSVKGEERTKVKSLDAGADDYITKPFGMDELLARIRAALRRAPAPVEGQSSSLLEAGDFQVDLAARTVTVAGKEIHLTPKEYDLMSFLMRNAGKVLTHRTLLAAVWGGNYTEQTEYLRVFVGQLRKKIEADPAHPRYILTEPWVGYRFHPEA